MNTLMTAATAKYLQRLAAALLLLLVAGCALSPQVVEIRPAVTVTAAPAGTDKGSLTLQVNDGRDGPIVGRRGGVYSETATIRTRKEITPDVQQTLAIALERMGYRVTAADTAPLLAVEIAELKYTVVKEKVTRTIETRARVVANLRADNRTYTNSYKITRTREMLTAPDAGENETLINQTLSAALQRMLGDRELFERIDARRNPD